MSRSDSSRIYENSKDLAEIKKRLKLLNAEVSDKKYGMTKMDKILAAGDAANRYRDECFARTYKKIREVNKKLDLIMEHLGIEGTK